MYCPKCGHKNPDDAAFCMKCGQAVQASAPSPEASAAAPPWQAPGPPPAPSAWAPPNPASPDPAAWPAPSYQTAAPPSPEARPHNGAVPLQSEQQVWSGSTSWKGLLTLGWIAAFVVPIPLIIAAITFRHQFGEGHERLWMVSLLSLVPLFWFAIRLWMIRTTTYRITTERISVLKGILSRQSDDIQLMRVADVQFFQPLLGRLLNVGDVRVLSTDKAVPDLVIPGVESPSEFKEMLWNLVRERRRNLVALEQLNQGLGLGSDIPPSF